MSNPNHDPKTGKFASGHNAGGGNRKVAQHIAGQHTGIDHVVLYHGTEKSKVDSILNQGILPSHSNYGGKVYLSTSKNGAASHARMRSALSEDRPVVLKVHVPKSVAAEFNKDKDQKNALHTNRHIPPNWLKK